MKIKKFKEYECGQNDDDDDVSVVMVFVRFPALGNLGDLQ